MSKTGVVFWLAFILFAILFPIFALRKLDMHPQPKHAVWAGERWSCPAGQVPYASEDDVAQNKEDFVYCVR